MNTLHEKDLESVFCAVCRGRTQADVPDLWPGVEVGITRGRPDRSGLYRRLGFAGSFVAVALVVAIFSAPGFTQNALERLKRLLGGDFSMVLGGAEISGVLVVEDGEQKELAIDRNLIKVRLSSFSAKTIMVEVEVYLRDGAGDLKLALRPKIVTAKGSQAEIKVTDWNGQVLYKLAIIPGEASGSYRGTISRASP